MSSPNTFVVMLETFKKKAQLLADAQNNKVEKLYQLSDYELTVKNAIKRAEMEEGDDAIGEILMVSDELTKVIDRFRCVTTSFF